MNDLQFAGRYQCLPIRCSERLTSLQNEHPIYSGYKKKRMGHRAYFILLKTVAPANGGSMDEMVHRTSQSSNNT
jgi:hypothetical protein